MTYFGFLALFLIPPIILLLLFHGTQKGKERFQIPQPFQSWPARGVIIGLIIVAVLYTTPWDNYLVATEVWWYDPALVTGIVIGYVPIEEYTFFVLQTLFTGVYHVALLRIWPAFASPKQTFRPNLTLRRNTLAVIILAWLISTVLLILPVRSANYLTLILSWALIPIAIQIAFGADILWHYRRLVLWAIVPPTLYLAWGDLLAIQSGTWTISPEQTVGIYLFGQLPLEEFLFFLVTNILVGFGMTLLLARESHARTTAWLGRPLSFETIQTVLPKRILNRK